MSPSSLPAAIVSETATPETELVVRAAWMYYEEGFTQQEIAERLGLSRVKVTRLIKQAHEQGIVEIKIQSPMAQFLPLEQELRQKFNLMAAYVTIDAEQGEPLQRVLANAAARVLEQRLYPGILVGLGFGHTTSFLPEYFHPRNQINCTFIVLTGGLPTTFQNQNYRSPVERLARQGGGKFLYLNAPLLASSMEIRKAILSDRAISEAIELARKCEVALLSVGQVKENATLIRNGMINQEDFNQIIRLGGVGDALGRFYNKEGQELDTNFNKRLIGLSIDELREIPTRIVVAGGLIKIKAILGALRGGIANILITDAGTGRVLIDEA